MSNQPQPAYYAIIPAEVRYCKNLEPNAKLLYGEITALCNLEGFCWATNKYFADLYDVDVRTVKRWLESLKENNFIHVESTKKAFDSQRKIYINHQIKKSSTEGQKCPGGEDKNVHSTIYNNTNNNVVGKKPLPKENMEKKLTKDDVYHHSLSARKDWQPAEIESAWLAFEAAKVPITDPFAYIEGIINKKRILHAAKERKAPCKQKQNATKTKYPLNDPSVNSKGAYSNLDMSAPSLARFN